MNHLKQSLTKPLSNPAAVGAVFLLIVAILGFADAGYLTIEHYRNVIPPCTNSGCETVLTSDYSTIMGIPVSLLGALYYLTVAIGAAIYLEARFVSKAVKPIHLTILKWTLLATILGLAASAWFMYLQAFVIRAFCQYCLGSAATSTILFLIAMTMLAKNKEI